MQGGVQAKSVSLLESLSEAQGEVSSLEKKVNDQETEMGAMKRASPDMAVKFEALQHECQLLSIFQSLWRPNAQFT